MKRALVLLLIAPSTAGCVTRSTEGEVSAARFCVVAEPIYYSSTRDSADTVAAIRVHNQKWVELCK